MKNELEPNVGNCLPLRKIPLGTEIHNVEMQPGRGPDASQALHQTWFQLDPGQTPHGVLGEDLIQAELDVWLSWRWMYWFYVPVALLAMVLVWRYLIPDRPPKPTRLRIDWLAVTIFTGWTVAVTFAFSWYRKWGGWTSNEFAVMVLLCMTLPLVLVVWLGSNFSPDEHLIRQAPKTEGVLEMIVRRPEVGAREVIDEGRLDPAEGLVGDNWKDRTSARSRDRLPNPDTQLNIMSARVIALLAQEKARWPLAGDQLFVDLDLSAANLPPGTRLAIGSAIVEVSEEPHTGCGKFVSRFGIDATTFVNSTLGRELQLRGINARVVQAGAIRVGDVVKKTGVSPL